MQNWFETLSEALEAENLSHTWDCFWPPIGYDETRSYHVDDGTKYGRRVSIYRDSQTGRYERPVHYSCN